MALNPNGASEYKWNYKDGEMELYGTILTMQEVQAREFTQTGQPGRPRFWPEGNPVLNIRIGLADPNGKFRSVTFAEAGKKQRSGEKPSLHMNLYRLSGGAMRNLIGKTVHLWTYPAHPQTGQTWGTGNPRIFGAELVDATYELAPGVGIPDEFTVPVLLCNDAVHGGQVAPQAIQQPQVPPMQGQFYAAPSVVNQQPMMQQPMQQMMQQQPMQQMMQQQPMQSMMQQQPMMQSQMQQQMPTIQAMPPQQQSAPMPQGMDPAVAQAMQAVGAVNVQPVQPDPTGGIYDDDIPFN